MNTSHICHSEEADLSPEAKGESTLAKGEGRRRISTEDRRGFLTPPQLAGQECPAYPKERSFAPSGLRMTLIFLFAVFFCQQAFAAFSLEITGYTYRHNFAAGEAVTLTVNVKNTGEAINGVYLAPVLTNSATGQEVYPAGSAAQGMAVGATATFTSTWAAAVAGKYSVTLIMYGNAPAADTEVVRKYGAYPIRVGSPTETLKTFPPSLNLGILPYGRYMYPVPLEVTFDFFLFNVLGEQKPWYMRIYTDNTTRYRGIDGSVYAGSPAGLVSSDGHYAIPLRVWCLNYPPDNQETGWDTALSGPPPVDDDTYWKGPISDTGEVIENKAAWVRIPDYNEMTSDSATWRNLIGQDFYNTQYATDTNRTGDFTLKNPFSVYFATETGSASVKGNYSCNLILEIYSP